MSDHILQSVRPVMLIYDALLRPARFAAFLRHGRTAVALAAKTTIGLLGLVLGGITLGLWLLGALDGRMLLAATLLAIVMVALLGYVCSMLASQGQLSIGVFSFGWLRCLIAITPLALLLLNVLLSPAFAALQNDPRVLVALLLVIGAWIGGALSVGLILVQRSDPALTRWILAGGALVIGAYLWLTSSAQAETAILAVIVAGSSIGLIRPLSYVWQAPLSLTLALAARRGLALRRLLAWHPVRADELILLPLPGLRDLLIHACARDLSLGGEALVQVAQHRGQHGTARAAVVQIVREGRYAHRLLLWLSTRPAGIALLGQICDRSMQRPALVTTYQALAAVDTPEEWPSAIRRQQATIEAASVLPGGAELARLLSLSQTILSATRWIEATAALHSRATSSDSASTTLGAALALLDWWTDWLAQAHVDHDLQHLLVRLDAHADLAGWPGALVAAVGEHLLFLLTIDAWRSAQVKE